MIVIIIILWGIRDLSQQSVALQKKQNKKNKKHIVTKTIVQVLECLLEMSTP